MDLKFKLALLSMALLGMRHGFDYDHIAAISDLTSLRPGMRQALRLGFDYVLGHAFMVALLGGMAILLHRSLPGGIDRWTGRVMGATLIGLGAIVFHQLARRRSGSPESETASEATPRVATRVTLLVNGVLWLAWRMQRLWGGRRNQPVTAFADGFGHSSAFLVGIVHGVGAETPSQLLVFLLAAGLGSAARGLIGLGVFILGLVLMNGLMCALAVKLLAAAGRKVWLPVITGFTAAYSIAVGCVFLFGLSLPTPWSKSPAAVVGPAERQGVIHRTAGPPASGWTAPVAGRAGIGAVTVARRTEQGRGPTGPA